MATECNPDMFGFKAVEGRAVVAAFDGGAITCACFCLWDAGERLPSQQPNSIMRCACGESFDSHRLEESLIHVPHLSAANEIRRAEPLH